MAALFTGAVQLVFLANVIWSRFRGAPAPANPWQATSLEWSTSSPPPFDNFGGRHPVVVNGPNDYGAAGPDGDYRMQARPEPAAT
jgi:cytochrome c oxidase subunit 1